jgi:hypothetical protein
MADYHPLIARAVAGLEKNTGENRRALYERARTALVAQLRGVVPALDESEITRERLALEEAIRKVEAESARHARETARPTFAKRAEIPRREETPRSTPPAASPPAAKPDETPAPDSSAPASSAPASSTSAPVTRRPTPRTLSTPRSLSDRSAPSRSAPSTSDNGGARESMRGSRTLQDEALRGFRGVANDPNGGAASRRSERHDDAESGLPPAPSLERHPLEEYGQLEPQVQPENLWAPPHGAQPDGTDDFAGPHPAGESYDAQDARDGHDEPPRRRRRSYGTMIRVGLVLMLALAVGGLAYWQRSNIASVAGSVVALFHSPAAQQPRETSRARPKITDRIGQPTAQPSSGPPVAQRVVLYEEDPDDPQGKRFVGTVVWRTEMKPASPGRPPELAVRADIEVPERKMSVTWSLRRNTDQSLPASHTIEIVFNLPADSPSGGVQNVPGVLMKQSESTRGVPLAGLAVKVTPGFFLIGLSSLEPDMQRNIQLLKDRAWFDIPIVYNNNRRAILAMEKGTPGEKAFAEAFAAWKQ